MLWQQEDRLQFLNRAEELRDMAGGCRIPDNRKMLLNMAQYYERFAREIEVRIWEREHEATH